VSSGEEPLHCATCADEAVAMRVLEVDDERGLAVCRDVGGERFTVETELVEGVVTGGWLLVHAGTAIAPAGGAALP
jgi:hydrogenase maturation factor